MSKRNKIIIIIGVIVLIIVIALIWWLFIRKSESPVVNINQPVGGPQRLPVTGSTNTTLPALVEAPELEAVLKAVATTFTERFGSYSNQGYFQNLDDLRDLMTIKMRGWANNFIQEQKTGFTDDSTYYGITTQALSVIVTDFDEILGRAEVMINTQRQEAKGDTVNPRVFYQKILLRLVKTNEGWKVDEAIWQ